MKGDHGPNQVMLPPPFLTNSCRCGRCRRGPRHANDQRDRDEPDRIITWITLVLARKAVPDE